jgi:hypothetical protein
LAAFLVIAAYDKYASFSELARLFIPLILAGEFEAFYEAVEF